MFLPRDGCFDTAETYLELDMLVFSLNVQIESLYAHLGPNYACWCLNDPFHSQMNDESNHAERERPTRRRRR